MDLESLYRSALELHQSGRFDEAARAFAQVVESNPKDSDLSFNAGLSYHYAGNLPQAEKYYLQSLQINPHHAMSCNNLGVIKLNQGDIPKASEYFVHAIDLNRSYADAWNNLGICHRKNNRFDLAMEHFQQAVNLAPDDLAAMNNLGFACLKTGRLSQAKTLFEKVLAKNPDFTEARWCLAIAFEGLNQFAQQEAQLRILIQKNPKQGEAWGALGHLEQRQHLLDEAHECYQKSIELKPSVETRVNLAILHQDIGEIRKGIDELMRALDEKPDQTVEAVAWSNILFSLHQDPRATASSVLETHRRWDQEIAVGLRRKIEYTNSRDPDRRLKVGFVSADFRDHTVMRNLLPLLRERNRAVYEAVCYSDVAMEDRFTQLCRQQADLWVSCRFMNDDQLADRVLADGIDILVDLAGHSAGNRMLLFARKPAPVQVSWVGYPGTTGLSAMDYRLSDAGIDPVGKYDADYVEKTLRLRSYWCYDPLGDSVEVNPSPAMKNGRVTFGNLGHSGKVNDETAQTWGEILRRVPGSKLVLLGRSQLVRDRITRALGDSAQVEFVEKTNREEYLKRYHDIDVVLDTFPYNGPSTGMDALWMGVAVVTLAGELGVGRGMSSVLNAVGLGALVGATREEYIELAAKIGQDHSGLSLLRQELRGRMQKSPLMDLKGFARDMEKAFVEMWRQWIEGERR